MYELPCASYFIFNFYDSELQHLCGEPGPPLPLCEQLCGPRQPTNVRALHLIRIHGGTLT